MLTESGDPKSVVTAIKRGAFHYIHKPPIAAELMNIINLAWADASLKRRAAALEVDLKHLEGEMVVADQAMTSVLKDVERVAPHGTTVLITGESGTGKELIARRIHARSSVAKGPFMAVNCAAIPENLIETELMGHVRGTFTGADRDRIGQDRHGQGRHVVSRRDRLCLACSPVQAAAAIEDEEFYFGASQPRPMQARIVVATAGISSGP